MHEHDLEVFDMRFIDETGMRRAMELAHHLTHAERWDALVAALTGLGLVAAKINLGQLAELRAYYAVAEAALPEALSTNGQARLQRARDPGRPGPTG